MLAPFMRAALVLALLLSASAAQETAERKPEHDALGFPVTFNEEIITRNDVMRRIGAPAETLGPGTLRANLEQMLMDKVTERIAEMWSINVGDREVQGFLQREIDLKGGDAKFYQYLDQQGTTLPRYMQWVRLQILKAHIDFMLTRGQTPAGQVVPFNLGATPEEVRIAFEHDKERREAGVRVRALEFKLDVDTAALIREFGVTGYREEKRKRIDALAKEVLAELGGGVAFEKIAGARGADVEAQKKRWITIPAGEQTDPAYRFYLGAKPGQWSEPIPLASGGCRLVQLLEINRPGERGLADETIAASYVKRIRTLRRSKVQALVRLRALDASTLLPERVRDEFRGLIVASLRESQEGLRSLGLH